MGDLDAQFAHLFVRNFLRRLSRGRMIRQNNAAPRKVTKIAADLQKTFGRGGSDDEVQSRFAHAARQKTNGRRIWFSIRRPSSATR